MEDVVHDEERGHVDPDDEIRADIDEDELRQGQYDRENKVGGGGPEECGQS